MPFFFEGRLARCGAKDFYMKKLFQWSNANNFDIIAI